MGLKSVIFVAYFLNEFDGGKIFFFIKACFRNKVSDCMSVTLLRNYSKTSVFQMILWNQMPKTDYLRNKTN